MKAIAKFMREAAGLFFDDGRLALTVLLILDVTATLVYAGVVPEPAALACLVGGVACALLENVLRTARAARAPG